MKNLYLLGATGSIGTQTLEVISSSNIPIRLVSMSFGDNIDKAKKIIEKFKPKYVCSKSIESAEIIKKEFPNIEVGYGDSGLIKASTYQYYNDGEDVVLNAVVGMIGLIPTIEAIKKRRTILIANKETLVVGGEIITKLIKEYNVTMLPIDSEHSAIFQCLEGRKKEEVSKLIITASGGAFREYSRDELENVTIEDALKHPNWLMGKKITVDCATMVNKGLEVIEAHFLFDMPYEKIETIIHKESIVHSMVAYNDNTIIAQMGKPDMRIPIQYSLTYPSKNFFPLDSCLSMNNKDLSFREMDFSRYPMLKLAYNVGLMGGIMPTVFNASNEEAVWLFINKKIKFLEIEDIINYCVNNTKNIENPSIEDILEVDRSTRAMVWKLIERK